MDKSSDEVTHEKIFFRLQKDEDGYPPDDWESLWAYEVEPGLYSIDNVPFFVRGVSWGDVVSAEREEGELHFRKVVRPSGNSVIRVILNDSSASDDLHESLERLGCDTEQSHLPSLISVDIPTTVDLGQICSFLDSGEVDGRWEYEEASIRHPSNSGG